MNDGISGVQLSCRSDVDVSRLFQDESSSCNNKIDEVFLHSRAVGRQAMQTLFQEGFKAGCHCKKYDCQSASIYEVRNMRMQVWGDEPDRHERFNQLLKLFNLLSIATTSNMDPFKSAINREPTYKIGSLTVCEEAWANALGMNWTDRMFRRAQNSALSGTLEPPKEKRYGKAGVRADGAIAWLLCYAEDYGDFSPVEADVIFLQERLKKGVYARYKDDMISLNQLYLSHNRFLEVWIKRQPLIKCITESPGFKKCQTCFALNELSKIPYLKKVSKVLIELLQQRHYTQQMRERVDLLASCQISMLRESRITLLIDGMDQHKCQIPGWNNISSSNETYEMEKFSKLGQLLIGVRAWYNCNGPKETLYLFVIDGMLKKNSNSTIECIHRAILDIHSKFMEAKRPFPEFLRVQADNASDNKSKFVFGYLSDLARRRIFLKLTIAFLYRGHTHSCIDQVFSVVARALRHHRTVTTEQFDQVVLQSTQAYRPTLIRLKLIHDCKSYYNNCLCAIKGHSKPHQFRFWSVIDGSRGQYRQWASSMWYPDNYIPKEVVSPLTRRSQQLFEELNKERTDENGIVRDSVLNDTTEEISAESRVVDELSVDYIQFMARYPRLDSIPGIAPFKSIDEIQGTLTDLAKYRDSVAHKFFEDAEFDALQLYLNRRIALWNNKDNILSTWKWPVTDKSDADVILASRSSTIFEQWKIADAEGMALLDKKSQNIVLTYTRELDGEGPNSVKSSAKKNKKKPILAGPRRKSDRLRTKRKRRDSSDESSSSSSSSSSSEEESDQSSSEEDEDSDEDSDYG